MKKSHQRSMKLAVLPSMIAVALSISGCTFSEINKMQKTEMEARMFSEYEEQFFYFFAAGLILLLLEFLILERKNKYLRKIQLFK